MLDSCVSQACILLLISLTLVAANDPLYTISAPNTFSPNAPYQLLVTNHQAPQPINVIVELKNTDNNATGPLVEKATIEVGQTKLIELPVGSWDPGTYSLTINGSGGIEFSKTSNINYNAKTFSAFIQTDKAVYKPGQTVQFRIITTDVQLKPQHFTNTTVYIIDSQGNRVKQWLNVTFYKGVFEGNLPLSDQVILGEWQIQANIKKNEYKKDFTIDEYVLPTFEVTVKPPSFATRNESNIIITVEAKYTYGKPVKGKLLLNVTDPYCAWNCRFNDWTRPFTLTTTINGKANIKIDLIKDLAIPDWMTYKTFDVFVAVTEDLTGRQQNSSAEFTMYGSKYKLSFSDGGYFKPGLKYVTTLRVTLQDGSPILEDGEISVRTQDNILNYTIPKTGEIDIEIIPSESDQSLQFLTEYKGAYASSYVRKARSLSDRYLQITLKSEKPKIGDEIELVLDSTKVMNDPLILQVIGRGKILFHKILEPSKSKTQQLKLKVTPDMAPKVRIIVYYATDCGEVVADAVDFSVDGIFKTKVNIEASPNSTKPGSPIDVNVITEPDAYVAILAVDQSVLLLKSGNDIATKDVLNDLQSYEIGRQSDYSYKGNGYTIRPWKPQSESATSLFSDVGLIFFSNGLHDSPSPSYYPHYYPVSAFRPPPPPPPPAAPLPMATTTRPMLTTPFGGLSPPLKEPTRVRRHFPETFLWTNVTAGLDGVASIKTNAPDTITSYVITAFAMDENNGLGLSESPAKLQIFRPFFVALNLPYSIVRGEAVALQALVFNYLKEDVEAEVTLESDALQFIELENSVDDDNANQQQITKKIKALVGEGTSVTFLVSAKKLDYIDIKVTARSAVAADAMLKKLLVKAEGKTVYFNKPFLIDLRENHTFQENVVIDVPNDAVNESEKIEVSAIADVMGSTINNLDQLLRMPYGCGEQNMLNFVPNIVITEYLTKTKQLNDDIKAKAIKFMETGYQRELTYKRNDNSFSAFGNGDKSGSVWLTAFVAKSFVQAEKHIAIDPEVVNTSLAWLASHQAENGSFSEIGSVLNKAMQGGAGKGLALTAYVLSSFLESKDFNQGKFSFENTTNSALKFLEEQLANIEADYDLVLTAYVLNLAGSSKKDEAFAKMNQRAKRERDVKYWSMPVPEVNETVYYNRPKSVDVEMTSYALLTYVLRGIIPDAIPIMRWLISKRNSNGGFESTQDTVLGIQALAKFAASLTPSEGSKVDISVSYDSEKQNFALSKENALILHREQIPRTVREVSINAEGNGVGIVQVSWSYNILNADVKPAFEIRTNTTSHKEILDVNACVKYVYGNNEESNMAILEIAFPSGYTADTEYLPTRDEQKKIKRVETKKGDTVVVVYFDKIGQEVCTSTKAHRAFKVAKMKPALVQAYDYYDPVKRGEQFYDAPDITLCDLCETLECKNKEKCV